MIMIYMLLWKTIMKKHDKNQSKQSTHYSDQFFDLADLQVISNATFPSASVKIRKGDEIYKASAVGSGPIDALYSAIADITGIEVKLVEYNISWYLAEKKRLVK